MARSRKKQPVMKDKNDWYYKRQSNKRYRKRPLELTDIKPYHLTNSWDICDWGYYNPPQPEYVKYMK